MRGGRFDFSGTQTTKGENAVSIGSCAHGRKEFIDDCVLVCSSIFVMCCVKLAVSIPTHNILDL